MSRRGNQWLAKIAGKAGLSVIGHNTRTVRRLIADIIREQFGDVGFKIEIVLSREQQAALRKYRADEKLMRILAESVPRSRLRWVEDLLSLNLSQGEVAELLGMTRSHVAVTLKRAHPTAKGRDPAAKRGRPDVGGS